ncbi:MAG: alkaline phosphatase family protein [Verrucomicrobia subdivision 3 bacterium]|nr:alkaline phosphatase family protein [Verrucomicrobiota bacterium]MCC6820319.1 alkaline phosphatase family protein [Limisphaerales bacterium]
MTRTAVINVVGLSESLLGPDTPFINAFRQRGALGRITPAFPAVTCTAQSNYLTGRTPAEHGIVGNGWYHRELAEVQFWKQSNHLVAGKKIWATLREADPSFTCAKLFWWFNMYSGADWSITPRPMYPADGRKLFDIYAWPYFIRDDIKRDLGEFPFPGFWGPAAGVDSSRFAADAVSRWIAESAKWIERKFTPTLNLVYLPHLDYNLQRLGPAIAPSPLSKEERAGERRQGTPNSTPLTPALSPLGRGEGEIIASDLRRIDAIVGDLLAFFEKQSVQVVLLSEYGISAVDTPIHLNRSFRERGWLTVKEELGCELLDAGASQVFAVADHQVAHVYVNDPALESAVRSLLESQPGVAEVWAAPEKRAHGIDHPRAGDLIAVARDRAWFTYYYWLEDRRAPDFARTVDIHRKPGYDPVELFLDPKIPLVKARIVWRLLQKRLGFRMLMDVVPLDASLVKGSHGNRPGNPAEWPVMITSRPELLPQLAIDSTAVFEVLGNHVMGTGR